MNKSIFSFIISLFIGTMSYSQFFDFNIFKPSIALSSQFVLDNPTDSLSIGVNDYSVSALIPIKSKFDVEMNWGNVLKSKGLKDAFKNATTPKFNQIFARVGAGYRTYQSELFRNPVDIYNFSAGITGINLKLKSGKFRFFMYSLNVKLQEQLGKYNQVSPSVSGLIGSAKIFDYRTGFFYGLYANYFGKRVIPAPVLAFYYKLNKKSTFLLAFPYQVKYDITFDKIKQDFAVSLTGYSNGIFNDSIYTNSNSLERLNFQNSQLRFSSQTRFQLAKKSFVYIEAGWQDLNSASFYEGYENYRTVQLKGNLFVKATFRMVFGKSLFNSSAFDFDL